MNEVWKEVEDYGGLIEISNKGRIRNVDREIEYSDGRKYKYKGRIMSQQVDHGGYMVSSVFVKGKRRQEKIHRLVAFQFVEGFSEERNIVNHIDGDKKNNTSSNLEWCTPAENLKHAAETGLMSSGERHYAARLTNDEALEIRREYENNAKIKDLATRYNVTYGIVYCIVTKRTYKGV